MKSEKVIHWMSTNLITIDPRTKLPEAYKLLKTFNIRRLPVVDFGKLVGIVTLDDIREARPCEDLRLSIYDLNYLVSQMRVDKIMSDQPITISPEATIGQAAKLMHDHRIGCLPVIENDRLLGMITESDIFRVMARKTETIPDELAQVPESAQKQYKRTKHGVQERKKPSPFPKLSY
jgi:CBS domain-containing protein